MVFKIIEMLESELFKLAWKEGNSKQFKSDLLDAIKAIRKIKKYF
jgi:hypothetical protein